MPATHMSFTGTWLGVIAALHLTSVAMAQTNTPTWEQSLRAAEGLARVAQPTTQQRRETLALYRQAADSGAAEAQLQAGCYLYNNAALTSQDEARSLIRRAANQADPYAMLSLAKFTAFGIGGDRNDAEALRLVKEAQRIFNSTEYQSRWTALRQQAATDDRVYDAVFMRRMTLISCGPIIQDWAKSRGVDVSDVLGFRMP